jgi:hypothetical protein
MGGHRWGGRARVQAGLRERYSFWRHLLLQVVASLRRGAKVSPQTAHVIGSCLTRRRSRLLLLAARRLHSAQHVDGKRCEKSQCLISRPQFLQWPVSAQLFPTGCLLRAQSRQRGKSRRAPVARETPALQR